MTCSGVWCIRRNRFMYLLAFCFRTIQHNALCALAVPRSGCPTQRLAACLDLYMIAASIWKYALLEAGRKSQPPDALPHIAMACLWILDLDRIFLTRPGPSRSATCRVHYLQQQQQPVAAAAPVPAVAWWASSWRKGCAALPPGVLLYSLARTACLPENSSAFRRSIFEPGKRYQIAMRT